MKFVHFVETFIGYDRPTLEVPLSWVAWRARFFERYTLSSLKNQTKKNFFILVQCGIRHQSFLQRFPWDSSVSVSFDKGREIYSQINADYLVITRIDSDDLFHKDNIAEIQSRLVFNPTRREVLVYKTRIVWDMLNHYVISAHPRASSPFVTHIFPRAIFNDYEVFADQHFRSHGKAGAGDLDGRPLRDGRVCVIKHGRNISTLKRGKVWPKFSSQEDYIRAERRALAKYPFVKFFYGDKVLPILKEFGMTKKLIDDEEGILNS